MIEPLDRLPGYNSAHVVQSELTQIEAPASVVWNILTDLPRYGEWNPFCVKAVSTLEIGAPIEMTLTNYWSDRLAVNIEIVRAVEPETMLSWGLDPTPEWPYSARRDQTVEALGADRCSYRSVNAFLGDTGVHVKRFCGDWVKTAFDDTARALKARAEAMHAKGPFI